MTTARTPFTGFEPYKLTGVAVTEQVLRKHSSYATVLELKYMGVKCAGKKIHERDGTSVHRFEEECRLLSQIHHPNIVQFMGVHFQQGIQIPILVMEFLPGSNLTLFIERFGHSLKSYSLGYSILCDVALGLYYLHSHTPPIMHRDLSSYNILLTADRTAKISDLGMAKIFNPGDPQEPMSMTTNPGMDIFMPPEVKERTPNYDLSIDTFSYGIVMIHIFSGQLPVGKKPSGEQVPLSEADRLGESLEAIGTDHPLMDLILKCINNCPSSRPHATEIVQQVRMVYMLQFPSSFSTEVIDILEKVVKQERKLTEENGTLTKEIQELTVEDA